jgi:hypothetical protein
MEPCKSCPWAGMLRAKDRETISDRDLKLVPITTKSSLGRLD